MNKWVHFFSFLSEPASVFSFKSLKKGFSPIHSLWWTGQNPLVLIHTKVAFLFLSRETRGDTSAGFFTVRKTEEYFFYSNVRPQGFGCDSTRQFFEGTNCFVRGGWRYEKTGFSLASSIHCFVVGSGGFFRVESRAVGGGGGGEDHALVPSAVSQVVRVCLWEENFTRTCHLNAYCSVPAHDDNNV